MGLRLQALNIEDVTTRAKTVTSICLRLREIKHPSSGSLEQNFDMRSTVSGGDCWLLHWQTLNPIYAFVLVSIFFCVPQYNRNILCSGFYFLVHYHYIAPIYDAVVSICLSIMPIHTYIYIYIYMKAPMYYMAFSSCLPSSGANSEHLLPSGRFANVLGGHVFWGSPERRGAGGLPRQILGLGVLYLGYI